MWEDEYKRNFMRRIILIALIVVILGGLAAAMLAVHKRTERQDAQLVEAYTQQQEKQTAARQEAVDAINAEYEKDMQTVREYLPGIVCWGDSITAGSSGNVSYPYVLQKYMRRSSIHKKLGIELMPGLSNLMEDTNSISTVVKKYQSSTDDTWFDIITGGSTPLNPSELLNSKRMEQLLKALKSVYDYIVIDLPPVGAVIDAVAVSKQTDGMLVVIRENNCPRRVLTDCVDQLKFANINILGFVMNGALEGAGKRYQYSSYYK